MLPSIAPHCLWFINPRDFFNVLPPSSAKPKLPSSRFKAFASLLKKSARQPKTATVQQAALSSVTGLASLGGAAVPTTGTAPDVAVSRVAESVAAFQSPADVAGNIPAFGHQESEVVHAAVEEVEEVEIEVVVPAIVEELHDAEKVEAVEEVPAEPAYGQIEELSYSPSFPTVAVTTVDSVLAELKEATVDAHEMGVLMQILENFKSDDAPVTIENKECVPAHNAEGKKIEEDGYFSVPLPAASNAISAPLVLANVAPSNVEPTTNPTIISAALATTPTIAPKADLELPLDIPDVDSAAIFTNIKVLQLADPGLVIAKLEDRVLSLEHQNAALFAQVGLLEAQNVVLRAQASSFEARIAVLETTNHNNIQNHAAPPGAPLPPAAPLPPPLPTVLVTGPPTAAITDAALQSATARLVKVDKANVTPTPSRGLLVTVEALKGVKLKRVPQPDAAFKTTGATTGPSPCGSSKTAPITKEAAAVGPARYLGELISKLPPRVPSEASRKDLARKAESAAISDTASSQQQPSQSVRLSHQHLSACEPRTSASADSLPTAPSFASMTASVMSNLFRLRRSRSREQSALETRPSSSAQSLARTQSSISTTSVRGPYRLHSVRSREPTTSTGETTTTTKFRGLRKALSPITNIVPSPSRIMPSSRSRSRNLTPTEVASRGLWGGSVKKGKKTQMPKDHPIAQESDKPTTKKHRQEEKMR
ncbi:hypothetical protein HMN09_00832800 [Mycena chlorophos]|uniref:Uncharacterized protein n=1 Tax=Mycena chlorophos TaxID=658473 RepID=A0A8H6SQR2_MYCCL|nr:hypothetical protein HMN09_00832800 [Mycena chlorophos]